MTGGHGNNCGDDGDEAGKKNWEKHPENAAYATEGSEGCDSADGTDTKHRCNDTCNRSSACSVRDGAVLDGDILNIYKEGLEGVTENITEINRESTDDIAEVYENSSNNNAWQDFLDTVVIDAEAG